MTNKNKLEFRCDMCWNCDRLTNQLKQHNDFICSRCHCVTGNSDKIAFNLKEFFEKNKYRIKKK